jgi:hypothetical protein
MAGFSAHVDQAIHNCKTLKSINQNVPDSWDWQVTTAFYTAVHLVNGHMAKIANHHYKSHVSVKQALFLQKRCSNSRENIFVLRKVRKLIKASKIFM